MCPAAQDLITTATQIFSEGVQGKDEPTAEIPTCEWHLWSRYGLKCFTATLSLLCQLFDTVAAEFLRPRVDPNVYRCYSKLSDMVGTWLFPLHLKGRRHNKDVELIWGAINCCKSLLWLRKSSCCRQARITVLQTLSPAHRDALCHFEKLRRAVTKVC